MRPNVVVRLDQFGRGTVHIDGKPLHGVRAITATAEVNCAPLVTISLLADSVDLQQNTAAEGVPDAAAQQ
jgi:hypothetical protein